MQETAAEGRLTSLASEIAAKTAAAQTLTETIAALEEQKAAAERTSTAAVIVSQVRQQIGSCQGGTVRTLLTKTM